MRIEEVLGPPGELKDLAFPARRHPCMCMLSPEAARAVSPKGECHEYSQSVSLFMDEYSAALLAQWALLSSSVL